MDQNQQDLVAQFCGVTGATPSAAQTALASANWDIQEAVPLYFAAQDDGPATQADSDDDRLTYEDGFDGEPIPEHPQPLERDLPAMPQAPAASSSSSSTTRKPPTQRPKQMTMDDLRKRNEGGDDEDSEDGDKKQDMYAGGEKSGLAVSNPGQSGGGPTDHFKNIMNQARQNRDRPAGAGGGGEEPAMEEQRPAPSTNFMGRAQTLGGDEAESQIIEDPLANSRAGQRQAATTRVSRTLHLWADGISIDDGPLFRFDDPQNQAIMAEINRGRAPLALLDVEPDQEVDLNLEPHKEENYVQPKRKYKPFGGSGQRLGSPTPGVGSSATTTTTANPTQSSTTTSTQPATAPAVDSNQPTIQLQIRLGDGTRLSSRFNTTHTIGDVYDFVNASSPASRERSYALMTTFPSKELEDRSLVLGEMDGFKRGGVVVQKWK